MRATSLTVLHWIALRALLSALSTLMIVLPISTGASRVRAQDASGGGEQHDSYNFSEQSAALDEAAVSEASGNAIKPRTTPVSSSGAFAHSVAIDVPPGR